MAQPSSDARLLGTRVVSGWDSMPVAGAVLVINGQSLVTDGTGQFSTQANFGAAVDVTAPGYLPRRTTLSPYAITMWPAAGDADAQAIRTMAFSSRDQASMPDQYESVIVSASFDGALDPAAARAAWAGEMAALGTRLGVSIVFGGFDYFWGYQVSFGATAATCPSSWGFCKTARVYPEIVVRPELAQDAATIRRALAFIFIRGHNQPGILNISHPSDTFSLLEEQTLMMLRLRGPTVFWPDTDASRR